MQSFNKVMLPIATQYSNNEIQKEQLKPLKKQLLKSHMGATKPPASFKRPAAAPEEAAPLMKPAAAKQLEEENNDDDDDDDDDFEGKGKGEEEDEEEEGEEEPIAKTTHNMLSEGLEMIVYMHIYVYVNE
jgi:hypothetical protein